MRLRAEAKDPASVEANVLAVPIYKEDDPFAEDLANLDAAAGGVIREAIDWGRFNIAEDYFALVPGGDLPVEHVLLVNGVRRGRGPWRARRMAGVATRALQGKGAPRMALWLRDGESADAVEAAAVGAVAGAYRPMDLYGRVRDTEAMKRNVEEVVFLGADQGVLDRAAIIADGVEWCRDLSNRAANDLYPEKMAEEAKALEADGCTVEVLHVPQMRQLGMGALLGVGQGGEHPPCLIAIKLPGWDKATDRRLAIVGKGVCFDSGGLSLKSADKMDEMKHDKSGAAAVIAAARTLARIAPECRGDGRGAHGREHARRTRAAPRRRRDGHEREDDRGHQHRCRRSPDPGRCPGLGRVPGSDASGGRGHPDRCRRDRLRRAHQRVLRQAARVGERGTGRGRCHRRVDLGDAPRHRVPDAAGHPVRRHREQRVARRVAHQERAVHPRVRDQAVGPHGHRGNAPGPRRTRRPSPRARSAWASRAWSGWAWSSRPGSGAPNRALAGGRRRGVRCRGRCGRARRQRLARDGGPTPRPELAHRGHGYWRPERRPMGWRRCLTFRSGPC